MLPAVKFIKKNLSAFWMITSICCSETSVANLGSESKRKIKTTDFVKIEKISLAQDSFYGLSGITKITRVCWPKLTAILPNKTSSLYFPLTPTSIVERVKVVLGSLNSPCRTNTADCKRLTATYSLATPHLLCRPTSATTFAKTYG
jgi:hypothetical protein